MKIGRNQTCPCGSGKKYKHCCLLLPDNPYAESVTPNPATVISDDLANLLSDRDFDSAQDVQAFAEQFMRGRNEKPTDDFHGLSPDTMHQMLNFPFESQDLFNFPEQLSLEATAPILTLLEVLFDQIGDGVKPTATGNLPVKICRTARLVFKERYPNYSNISGPYREIRINSEPDFFDLHVVRLMAELMGLLRVYRGKFILTGACKKVLKSGGIGALYPELLKAYSRQFNWGYWDGYEEMPFIQHGFLFSIYLLQLFGDEWLDSEFYADNYLNAFPMALGEVEDPISEPDVAFKRCYTHRCLMSFLGLLGLAEIRPTENSSTRGFQLRGTSLLGAAVQFASKAHRGNLVAH